MLLVENQCICLIDLVLSCAGGGLYFLVCRMFVIWGVVL